MLHPGQDREDRRWLLMQGYDAARDGNYIKIRDAETLDMAARICIAQHFPLGFHGNFTPMSFVAARSFIMTPTISAIVDQLVQGEL